MSGALPGFRGFISVTDRGWFEQLRSSGLDEVNFWQPAPSGVSAQPGTPWIFKLHYPENVIVGLGYFTYYTRMPISVAWETFGVGNGVRSYVEMLDRVKKYRPSIVSAPQEVGCVVLSDPIFLDESDWIFGACGLGAQYRQGQVLRPCGGSGRYDLAAASRSRLRLAERQPDGRVKCNR